MLMMMIFFFGLLSNLRHDILKKSMVSKKIGSRRRRGSFKIISLLK